MDALQRILEFNAKWMKSSDLEAVFVVRYDY